MIRCSIPIRLVKESRGGPCSAMACTMLLVYGCADPSHPGTAASKPAPPAGNESVSEDRSQGRVFLIDRDPPGVIALGKEEALSLLRDAIVDIDERKRSIETMELIAWASKSDALSAPPRLYEELVVFVRWDGDAGSSLLYLWRDVQQAFREAGGWELGLTDFSEQMRSSQAFDDVPSEAQIVDFVRATNFGHNEFLREFIVGPVFLYEHDYTKLLDLLQSGIPSDDQEARRRRYENALLEPLGPIP